MRIRDLKSFIGEPLYNFIDQKMKAGVEANDKAAKQHQETRTAIEATLAENDGRLDIKGSFDLISLIKAYGPFSREEISLDIDISPITNPLYEYILSIEPNEPRAIIGLNIAKLQALYDQKFAEFQHTQSGQANRPVITKEDEKQINLSLNMEIARGLVLYAEDVRRKDRKYPHSDIPNFEQQVENTLNKILTLEAIEEAQSFIVDLYAATNNEIAYFIHLSLIRRQGVIVSQKQQYKEENSWGDRWTPQRKQNVAKMFKEAKIIELNTLREGLKKYPGNQRLVDRLALMIFNEIEDMAPGEPLFSPEEKAALRQELEKLREKYGFSDELEAQMGVLGSAPKQALQQMNPGPDFTDYEK